jgi:[acyl-carrier-protein] S-malonyltransferase
VRWTETIEYLIDEAGCELFLEVGPGNVLCGLMNRIRKGTLCFPVTDSETLAAALPHIRAALG